MSLDTIIPSKMCLLQRSGRMRKKGMMTLVLSALLSLGIMAGTVWAAEGWTQEGSSWVYYDSNGRKVTKMCIRDSL